MGKLPYKNISEPKKLTSYWLAEWPLCLAIAFTGLLYNAGMLVSPYFEGRLVDAIEGGGQVGRTIVAFPAGILILGTYDPPAEAGPLRMLSRATSAFAQLEAERTSLQAVQEAVTWLREAGQVEAG